MSHQTSQNYNIEPMDPDGMYLGAVKTASGWRFFYDDRYKWLLDFTKHSHYIPSVRKDLLRVDRETETEFCASMSRELSKDDIRNIAGKLRLSVVVNFDARLFINGSFDEGFNVGLFVPDNWRSVTADAFYYVPSDIRDLWMTKHPIFDNRTGIHQYTFVGAVKLNSKWTFFYEQYAGWILDFEAYVKQTNKPDYFASLVYSDWRSHLPQVSEKIAHDYLQLLKPYELDLQEIPSLAYIPLANEYLASGIVLKQPELRFVVNFDEKVWITKAYYSDQVRSVPPEEVYAPPNWRCYQDETLKYASEDLAKLWTTNST